MVGDVIVHSDIITERFACDIAQCHGLCCEEGDAGAPISIDEMGEIEEVLDEIWPKLSASAQAVIERQGVAYADPEGDLVTAIVGGRDCAFRGPCGCLLPKKPMSCHLYPIRERKLGPYVGLNYHRWDICHAARSLGKRTDTPVYVHMAEALIRRFGQQWYDELCEVAKALSEGQ